MLLAETTGTRVLNQEPLCMASIFAISCWKIQENAELGPFAYGGGWGALWPLLQTADLKWSGKSGCNFFCWPESGPRDPGSLGGSKFVELCSVPRSAGRCWDGCLNCKDLFSCRYVVQNRNLCTILCKSMCYMVLAEGKYHLILPCSC